MIRSFGMLIGLAFVVASCGGEPDPTRSPATNPPAAIAAGEITLNIATEGGTVGGATLIMVTLTNGTDAPVTLVRPRWIPNFVKFTVLDEAGNPMPFYGPHSLLKALGDGGFVTLQPSQSTSEMLDLEPGYQLDAGTYRVSAEYRNAAEGSHDGGRALIFEHGDGPTTSSVELVMAP